MRSKEQSVCALTPEADAATSQAENLLGEWRALLQQVGSPEISTHSFVALWPGIEASLRDFLENYLSHLLLAHELPAIVQAFGYARRGEWRELVAQDIRLQETLPPSAFADASRRVGRLQLARLGPLRDERTVQRYGAAVQSGQAQGWHTMLYGLTLAVYSLPLRQGLLHYAQETLSSLAMAAGRAGNVAEAEITEIVAPLSARIPQAIALALQGEDLVSQVSRDAGTAG
jgi:urease accessory protein UreF